MTRKVFNYSGGLHSQAALTAFLTDALAGDVADGMKVVPNSGMKVAVQAGTGRIDTGQQFSHDIQVSGIELVDCGPANPSNPVNTLIVAYIDKSVRGDSSVTDNTNDVFKLKAVDGVASVEPVDPTTSAIQQSIGASNPYIILARVQKRTGSSNILESDITDLRKMVTLKSGRLNPEVIGRGAVSAENVDWATYKDVQLPVVRREVGAGWGSRLYLSRVGNMVICRLGGIMNSNPANTVANPAEKVPLGYRPSPKTWEQTMTFRMISGNNHTGAGVLSVSSDGSLTLRASAGGANEVYGQITYYTEDSFPSYPILITAVF